MSYETKTPEQLIAIIDELKDENAKRRIENTDIKNSIQDLKEKHSLEVKELKEQEKIKRSEMENSTESVNKEIVELRKRLSDYEKTVKTYQEKDLKEIDDLRNKLPDNLKEKFADVTSKSALLELVELTSKTKTDNSPLSELDSIIKLSRDAPKTLTLEQKQQWVTSDPLSYNRFIAEQMQVKK